MRHIVTLEFPHQSILLPDCNNILTNKKYILKMLHLIYTRRFKHGNEINLAFHLVFIIDQNLNLLFFILLKLGWADRITFQLKLSLWMILMESKGRRMCNSGLLPMAWLSLLHTKMPWFQSQDKLLSCFTF